MNFTFLQIVMRSLLRCVVATWYDAMRSSNLINYKRMRLAFEREESRKWSEISLLTLSHDPPEWSLSTDDCSSWIRNFLFSFFFLDKTYTYILFWTNSRVVSIFYLIALAVAESFRLARMQQRGERLTKLCFVWHCSSSGIGWCTLIIICCVCALLY